MNKADIEVMELNGVKYIRADSVTKDQKVAPVDGMEYCIVRTYSAGVFAGLVESQKGAEVVVRKARRLWYWDGAASLSQLAVDGVGKPANCKFPCEVDKILLINAVEIITVTEKAKASIEGVKVWKE